MVKIKDKRTKRFLLQAEETFVESHLHLVGARLIKIDGAYYIEVPSNSVSFDVTYKHEGGDDSALIIYYKQGDYLHEDISWEEVPNSYYGPNEFSTNKPLEFYLTEYQP